MHSTRPSAASGINTVATDVTSDPPNSTVETTGLAIPAVVAVETPRVVRVGDGVFPRAGMPRGSGACRVGPPLYAATAARAGGQPRGAARGAGSGVIAVAE